MGTIEALAKFLMEYGPWGVAALLVIAVVVLYRKVSSVTAQSEKLMMEVIRDGAASIESNSNAFHQVEERLAEQEQCVQAVKEELANVTTFIASVEKLLQKNDLQADEVRKEVEAAKVLIEHVTAQTKRRIR